MFGVNSRVRLYFERRVLVACCGPDLSGYVTSARIVSETGHAVHRCERGRSERLDSVDGPKQGIFVGLTDVQ
ncbi:hypothetical protein C8039_02450 [Halogeometricum sp. wsp3]|nr:hypothetical protein C8039_02450 [Halogeometricum sp. wsp3]